MNVPEVIKKLITAQPEPKRGDMEQLHGLVQQIAPGCRLWFDEGKNAEGKTITNPTIGYGYQTLKYADGKTKEFFQIGISTNATGISIYILGLKDKTYLAQTYGKELGKAKVTGYCIRFKNLKDINLPILEAAIRYGIEATKEN